MRALRFDRFGGPEVLHVDEVPEPVAGPNEVLVDVHAGGLNFADTERRRGLYLANEPLPETIGFEGAGEVIALGEGVSPDWLHRRVAFRSPRAHAECCVVPVDALITIPDEMTFVQAAAFPVQALTAWHLVHTVAKVKPTDTVLVHSAAGGVGSLLVQLLRDIGARTIGTVSRDGKQVPGVELISRGPEFMTQFNASCPNGVDVLFEAIGAEILDDCVTCLAPFGRWFNYGSSSGEVKNLNLDALFAKSASYGTFWLRTPMTQTLRHEAEREVLARLGDGRLRQTISTASLDDAARVHRRLEGGLTVGKWVLTMKK